MPLRFAFLSDWRLQAAIYRHHAGMTELLQQQRKRQARHGVYLVVGLGGALLALRLRLWIPLGAFVAFAAWQAAQFALSFGLARHAAFALRASFRRGTPSVVSLSVDDEGIREAVAGVESFAPWSSVERFFATERLIGIDLSSGRAIYIPVRSLDSTSSDTTSLLAQLASRGIPRTV